MLNYVKRCIFLCSLSKWSSMCASKYAAATNWNWRAEKGAFWRSISSYRVRNRALAMSTRIDRQRLCNVFIYHFWNDVLIIWMKSSDGSRFFSYIVRNCIHENIHMLFMYSNFTMFSSCQFSEDSKKNISISVKLQTIIELLTMPLLFSECRLRLQKLW